MCGWSPERQDTMVDAAAATAVVLGATLALALGHMAWKVAKAKMEELMEEGADGGGSVSSPRFVQAGFVSVWPHHHTMRA